MITFTEEQLGTISNALRVAAERFDGYAADLCVPRLVQQFERQAAQCRALHDLIAEREGIMT